MRRITVILMFLVIFMIFSTNANAQKQWLVGNFVTTDANTRGITRVTLTADDHIHVWAKCTPADCDWGTMPVDVYGTDVDSDLEASTRAVSAIYTTSFATTIVIVRPLTKESVDVSVFEKFTDRSGRKPYMFRQILTRREDIALKP